MADIAHRNYVQMITPPRLLEPKFPLAFYWSLPRERSLRPLHEFKLIGPRGRDFQYGSSATLSCHLSPEVSAVGMEIRWFKGTDCVCLYKNGQVTEGRGYEDRVSLNLQELKRGNVSLQIRNCRGSDTGDYLCQVTSGDTTEECTVRMRDTFPWWYLWEEDDPGYKFIIQQSDRKWTEGERKKMKESALLIGDFKLIGPRGGDVQSRSAVTLSCHLFPEVSAVGMEIRWFKETDCVCLYKNGQVTEGRSYEDRVSLNLQELQRGNVSLQITNCRGSDTGDYLCQVTCGGITEECTVRVENTFPWRDFWVYYPVYEFIIQQSDRKWTEEERIKMEESALLTARLRDFWEEYYPVYEFIIRLRNRKWTEESALLTARLRDFWEEDYPVYEFIIRQRNRKWTEESALLTARLMRHWFSDPVYEFIIQQEDRKWTEEERIKMEESALLTELKEGRIPDHELENLISLIKENKEQEEQLKKTETELENTVIQTHLKDGERERIREKIKKIQERRVKERERIIAKIRVVLEAFRGKADLMEQHKKAKKRELKKDVKRKDEQMKKLKKKLKQLQERTDPGPSAPVRRSNSMQWLPPDMSGETPDSAASFRRISSLEELQIPQMSGERCSAVSPASGPAAELRLVLLGRTGCGKSAAGNSILGREERSQAGASTVRQQSESRQGEVAGRQVTVVETPDCFCPGLSLEELRQNVEHCVRLSAPGPHAFLLVLPVKQSTGEERGMLDKMEEMFGEKCWRNTMILFTVTDEVQEKNIEEFIQSGNQEVQRLVEKCGNRFHCLNIKESGDDSQISELLEKIEKMVEENREKFYSSEIYLETQSQIRAMETKIMREITQKIEREERETRETLERCVQETVMKFSQAAANFNAKITQHEERITKLEQMLKEERDEKRKAKLQKELERERQQRNEVQSELKRLKEENENEKREMEQKHKQEIEKFKTYEGESRMKAEKNLKIFLSELQRYILFFNLQKQEFSRQMEEKDGELQKLRRKVRERCCSLLEEIHA